MNIRHFNTVENIYDVPMYDAFGNNISKRVMYYGSVRDISGINDVSNRIHQKIEENEDDYNMIVICDVENNNRPANEVFKVFYGMLSFDLHEKIVRHIDEFGNWHPIEKMIEIYFYNANSVKSNTSVQFDISKQVIAYGAISEMKKWLLYNYAETLDLDVDKIIKKHLDAIHKLHMLPTEKGDVEL